VLLSGGLDSMLAARTLINEGVEVTGITFISNFFGATRGLEAAKQLGVPLIAFNIADQHLEMTKNPRYGYGKNMNPCIDCHGMMLAKAKSIMDGEEVVLVYPDGSIKAISQRYDFVATGEVLGQRPMSQTAIALTMVEKLSGLDGMLVRPLSAKLLPLTKPALEGKIKNDNLLNFSGRGRSRQVELAAIYGIKDYPSPAGGCLLTDKVFGEKLKKLFEVWPNCNSNDVKVVKTGRNIWLNVANKKYLLEIGRNDEENNLLSKLVMKGDVIINVEDILGPTALLRSKGETSDLVSATVDVHVPRELKLDKIKTDLENVHDLYDVVALLVAYYANRARGRVVKVKFVVK